MDIYFKRIPFRAFELLKANPFFFLRFEGKFDDEENGLETFDYVSVVPEIGISIDEEDYIEAFGNSNSFPIYLLCLADIEHH